MPEFVNKNINAFNMVWRLCAILGVVISILFSTILLPQYLDMQRAVTGGIATLAVHSVQLDRIEDDITFVKQYIAQATEHRYKSTDAERDFKVRDQILNELARRIQVLENGISRQAP